MEKQYQSAEYVVVFMDILGAKDKIANGGDDVLNIIHRAYDQMMDALDGLFAGTAARHIKPKVKIFSDNIAICFPVASREKYKAFVAAILSSAFIQNQFLHNRYLLRGGIAIGKCYIDKTMIWGKALVDAYTAESSIAIYPRIVVHPETVAMLNLALDIPTGFNEATENVIYKIHCPNVRESVKYFPYSNLFLQILYNLYSYTLNFDIIKIHISHCIIFRV